MTAQPRTSLESFLEWMRGAGIWWDEQAIQLRAERLPGGDETWAVKAGEPPPASALCIVTTLPATAQLTCGLSSV